LLAERKIEIVNPIAEMIWLIAEEKEVLIITEVLK